MDAISSFFEAVIAIHECTSGVSFSLRGVSFLSYDGVPFST